MTLDEAIKHAEEVAKEQDKLCKQYYDDAIRYYKDHNENIVSANVKKCLECLSCANEHRQLAEWLRDYKRLLDQPKWILVSEKLPESDGCYIVTEKSGRVCTYVFHKEGNSEEYWKRCAVAWSPESYKAENE